MSWKFAEMKWRQDAGLYESSSDRWRGLKRMTPESAVDEDECIEDSDRSWMQPESCKQIPVGSFRIRDRSAGRPPSRSPPPPPLHQDQPLSHSSFVPLLRRADHSFHTRVYSNSSSANSGPEQPTKAGLRGKSDAFVLIVPQQPRDFLATNTKVSRLKSCLMVGARKGTDSIGYLLSEAVPHHFVHQEVDQASRLSISPSRIDSANTSALAEDLAASHPGVGDHSRKILSPDTENDRAHAGPRAAPSDLKLADKYRVDALNNTLAFQGVVFELFNSHDSLPEHLIVSPEDSLQIQDMSIDPDMGKLKNLLKKGKDGKNLRGKYNPPARIFRDLRTAQCYILSAKIPSASPGMESMEDPHAKLPQTVDLRRTPKRFRPGAADEELKAVADSTRRSEEPESYCQPSFNVSRPMTPFLPPTPDLGQTNRSTLYLPPTSLRRDTPETPTHDRITDLRGRLGGLESAQLASELGFGPTDIVMKPMRRISFHEGDMQQSRAERYSRSGSAPRSSSEDSLDRLAHGVGPKRRTGYASRAFGPSGTLESIIDRYDSHGGSRKYASTVQDGRRAGGVFHTSATGIGVAYSDDEDLLQHLEETHRPSPFSQPPYKLRQHRPAGAAPREPLPQLPIRDLSKYTSYQPSQSQPTQYGNTVSLLELPSQSQGFYSAESPGSLPPEGVRPKHSRMQGGKTHFKAKENAFCFQQDIPDKELQVHKSPASKGFQASFTGPGTSPMPYGSALGQVDDYLRTDSRWRVPTDSEGRGIEMNSKDVKDSEDLSTLLDFAGVEARQMRQQLNMMRPQKPAVPGRQEKSDVFYRPLDGRVSEFVPMTAVSEGERQKHFQEGVKERERAAICFVVSGEAAPTQKELEDDEDWVTYRGSGLQSQYPTQSSGLCVKTNPSLANVSSYGSLDPEQARPVTPWGPLPEFPRAVAHPVTAATPHSNRLRRDEQAVIVRDYRFTQEDIQLPRRQGNQTPMPVLAVTPREKFVPKHSCYPQLRPPNTSGRTKPQFIISTGQQMSSSAPEGAPRTDFNYSMESDSVILNMPPSGQHPPVHDPANISSSSLNDNDYLQQKQTENHSSPAKKKRQKFIKDNSGQTTPSNLGDCFTRAAEADKAKGEQRDSNGEWVSRPSVELAMEGIALESEDGAEKLDTRSVMSKVSADGSYAAGQIMASEAGSLTKLVNYYTLNDPGADVNVKARTRARSRKMQDSIAGAGNRAAGSSIADYSSEPATAKKHIYERLSDEDITNQAMPGRHATAYTAVETVKGKYKAIELVQDESSERKALQVVFDKGGKIIRVILDNLEKALHVERDGNGDIQQVIWDVSGGRWDVQKVVTGVTLSNGDRIGAPKAMARPWTLSPINSLELTRTQPLRKGLTNRVVAARISLAKKDWQRMKSPCPLFPLNRDHIQLKFRDGGERVRRDNKKFHDDGSLVEQMFCGTHRHWEFSRIEPLTGGMVGQEELLREDVWRWMKTVFVGLMFVFLAVLAVTIWVITH